MGSPSIALATNDTSSTNLRLATNEVSYPRDRPNGFNLALVFL
jgi:hypothetical protein